MLSLEAIKKQILEDSKAHELYDNILKSLPKEEDKELDDCIYHIVDIRFLVAKGFITYEEKHLRDEGYYQFNGLKLTNDGMLFITEKKGFIAEDQRLLGQAHFENEQRELIHNTSLAAIKATKIARWSLWVAIGVGIAQIVLDFVKQKCQIDFHNLII